MLIVKDKLITNYTNDVLHFFFFFVIGRINIENTLKKIYFYVLTYTMFFIHYSLLF